MQMIQEAADGDFIANPALVGILIIVAVIVAIYWYKTHCPNCKRIFTRELIKKDKAGRLPLVLSNKERRTYRCKNCQHAWDIVVEVD
jgi:hypothetical protein